MRKLCQTSRQGVKGSIRRFGQTSLVVKDGAGSNRGARRRAVDRPCGGDPALLRRPPLLARDQRDRADDRALDQHDAPVAGVDDEQPAARPVAPTGATGRPAARAGWAARGGALDAAGCGATVHGRLARRGRRDRRPARVPRDRRARGRRPGGEPPGARRHYTDIGVPIQLVHGAPGKAILSTPPWARQVRALGQEITAITDRTVTDPVALAAELAGGAAARLGRLRLERTPGIRALPRRSSTTRQGGRVAGPLGAHRADGRRARGRARSPGPGRRLGGLRGARRHPRRRRPSGSPLPARGADDSEETRPMT